MSFEKQIKWKTQKEKFVEDAAAVFASTEFVIVSFSAAS